MSRNQPAPPSDLRARVAIDLGAESCRVSLLRWRNGLGEIELLHRIPNGPVHRGGRLVWPIEKIVAGVMDGLTKAADAAPEGIASIAVDGWAVDYVRLGESGVALDEPYCYRDERTVRSKAEADKIATPQWAFAKTGAQPLRINTLYQLLADRAEGRHTHARWLCLPEYILYLLGAPPVAEYTNATHTGLVDLETGDWCDSLVEVLQLDRRSFPPIVPAGTALGKLKGPLAQLPAFRDTDLIAPACHDTASALAGISSDLDGTAYISSGTWSLVGSLIDTPIATTSALDAGFTNLGAAGGGFCFHTNVNGMWILKQCLTWWEKSGRPWNLEELVRKAEECESNPGTVPVSAPSLLLDGNMPGLLNEQLRMAGRTEIEDRPGNEPLFARMIFESLSEQYASTVRDLHRVMHRSAKRIALLGGGSRNALLTRLTAEKTGLPVECGSPESSTIGNFAVQLSSAEQRGERITRAMVQNWARVLSKHEA
ncbi:MAG: rhamnulokinase [Acidobacteriota bacterium]